MTSQISQAELQIHNLYVLNDIVPTKAHMLKHEKMFWLGAMPVDVAAHAVVGFFIPGGGPITAASLASADALHVVPSWVVRAYLRLKIEAEIRADRLIDKLNDFPGNELNATLNLLGATTHFDGIIPTAISVRSVYFFDLKDPLPPGYTKQIVFPDGTTHSISFTKIDNPDHVTFSLELVNGASKGLIEPWTISMTSLLSGLRIPHEKEGIWRVIHKRDPEHSQILATMKIGDEETPLGSFYEGEGVAKFLGAGFINSLRAYRPLAKHPRDLPKGEFIKIRIKTPPLPENWTND